MINFLKVVIVKKRVSWHNTWKWSCKTIVYSFSDHFQCSAIVLLKGVYFFEKNIKLGKKILPQPHLLVWRFHKISLRSLAANTSEPEVPEVGKGCHLVCIPGDTQNVTQNAQLMTFYWHFGCILVAFWMHTTNYFFQIWEDEKKLLMFLGGQNYHFWREAVRQQ